MKEKKKNNIKTVNKTYNNESSIWENIYFEYFEMIQKLITSNNGDINDAKDTYHYALKIIFEKAQKDGLTLNCSLKTYIYSICRNKWFEELRRKRKMHLTNNFNGTENNFTEDLLINFKEYDIDEIVHFHVSKLDERCKQLLKLLDLSGKELAEKMGFSSSQYARKQKYLCIKKLSKQIKKDPRLKNLKI